MTSEHGNRRGVTWLLAVVGVCLAGQAAAPADDEVLADDSPDAQAERQPHLIDLGSNFDSNLFERNGNSWMIRGGGAGIVPGGDRRRSDSPALTRARSVGKKRLERIDASCELSAAQRKTLELAIESDARRFAAEIDSVRERYAKRQINMNDQAGQKEWHAFQQDVQRCREQLRRLFDPGSLFATSLARTLDERQLACFLEEQANRRTYQWRALVTETLARLDDTLALTAKQHEALQAILMAREPLLRTDVDANLHADLNLRRNLVFMILAEADTKELRATVSERQWQTLMPLTAQGRAMRSWIEAQGVLELGEATDKTPASRRKSRSR